MSPAAPAWNTQVQPRDALVGTGFAQRPPKREAPRLLGNSLLPIILAPILGESMSVHLKSAKVLEVGVWNAALRLQAASGPCDAG